jgi:DnaJ-class molecular chaperone
MPANPHVHRASPHRAEHRDDGSVEPGPDPESNRKGDTMTSQSNTGGLNPGDESAPGTPQTAEDICPDCQGSGKQGPSPCVNCGGTGRVVKIIGDA